MSVARSSLPRGPSTACPTRCAAGCLEVSESWFYKWHDRRPTGRQQRRAELDAAVKRRFDDSGRHLWVAAGVRGSASRPAGGCR